jgi:hypothetical protein
MFSAKVVAQLLHKRRDHDQRSIMYFPGNESSGPAGGLQNDNHFFDRSRMDQAGYQDFGY